MTRPLPSSQRIFGHSLPDGLVKAIASDVHIPLLSESWFVASIVWGGTVAVLCFVLFGSAFLPGVRHANPDAVRAVLAASLLAGLASGLAGLAVFLKQRRGVQQDPRGRSPELHRAVALHRVLVAGLLLLFGLAAIWQAAMLSAWIAGLSILAFLLELALGFVALPRMLALLGGQSKTFNRTARTLDRILLLSIGLVSIVVALPAVARSQPGAFFLVLTQALSLLAVPWVAPMLAWARIHLRCTGLVSGVQGAARGSHGQ